MIANIPTPQRSNNKLEGEFPASLYNGVLRTLDLDGNVGLFGEIQPAVGNTGLPGRVQRITTGNASCPVHGTGTGVH